MNVLDLFSGIGGFSLGLERAGMRTVAFCERDEYCRAVLRKHWPDVPCFDDIHAIDADGLARLGRIDLVCGGFPCQPFSVAGKQRAQADDRHLWPEMRRVIALARPAWVVGENVTGIIALALDDVLADLEAIGYAARTFVIPAVAVDAKHRRDRVWIIARDANGHRQPAGAIDAEEMAELRGATADADIPRLEGRDSGVMRERESEWPAGSRGSSAPDSDRDAIREQSEPVTGRGRAALVTGPCRWEPEPDVGGTIDGISTRMDGNRGFEDAEAEETGANEVMRYLRETAGAEAIQWATRGLNSIQAEEILFAFLREYEAGGRLPRQFVARSATPEGILRAMRSNRKSSCSSLRRGSLEQFFREYPDALRELSRLVASRGETPWSNPLWESAVPRIAHGVPRRVDRLRCLGNAVVPQVVEEIGRAIMKVSEAT